MIKKQKKISFVIFSFLVLVCATILISLILRLLRIVNITNFQKTASVITGSIVDNRIEIPSGRRHTLNSKRCFAAVSYIYEGYKNKQEVKYGNGCHEVGQVVNILYNNGNIAIVGEVYRDMHYDILIGMIILLFILLRKIPIFYKNIK